MAALDPIAVLALLVSGVFAYLALKTSRQQNELQGRIVDLETSRERDRAREAQRAQLVAEVEHKEWRQGPSRGTEYYLRLVNQGRAGARDIRAVLDGQPFNSHPLIWKDDQPVSTLGPGADARFRMTVSMNAPTVFEIVLTWNDNSGEPGRWASQMKL